MSSPQEMILRPIILSILKDLRDLANGIENPSVRMLLVRRGIEQTIKDLEK